MFSFFSTEHDYTVRRHQEKGQNKTKEMAGKLKATTRAEDIFIRLISLFGRRLTALNITAQLNQSLEKNVSTSIMKRRFCEAGLYGRIAAKKPLSRKQSVDLKIPLDWWGMNLSEKSVLNSP